MILCESTGKYPGTTRGENYFAFLWMSGTRHPLVGIRSFDTRTFSGLLHRLT